MLVRPGGRRELGLLELPDRQIEHALEDSGKVAVRNLVTEQRLRVMQLVVSALPHGEMKREAPCGNRDDS